MEPVLIISVFAALIIIVLLMGAPLKPLRWIGSTLIKVVIGALLLFLLNSFGANLGLHVPINLYTAVISGVLGIPGIAALVVIQHWII